MTSPGPSVRSIPASISIATLLSLDNIGTAGAVTGQSAGSKNFYNDSAQVWHEGLLKIQVTTTGGQGATPTAVGASKTLTLKYAFSDDIIPVSDIPTVLATEADSLICALPNASSTQATGALTFSGVPANGDRIQIGGRSYSFYDSDFLVATDVTGASIVHADAVLIGASAAATATNLLNAINHTGTPGTDYHINMPVNTEVVASSGGAGIVNLKAVVYGGAGNAIVTTETSDSLGRFSFGAVTLTTGSAAGTAQFSTAPFVHEGKYLYFWYDRDAFAANALIDVTAKLIRL